VDADPLAAVTERLLGDRHQAVVDAIASEVFDRHPVYAGLRDKAGFRRGVAKLVELHCATVAGHRRLTAAELVSLHVIGAQRAREGIPEEDMVGTVDSAVTIGWDQFVDVLTEVCPDPDEIGGIVKEVFRRTAVFVDDVQGGLCSGYRSENEQRLPSHVRVQATVVDRLLDGSWTDDALYQYARECGVVLLPPMRPILVTGRADIGRLREAATAVAGAGADIIEGPVRTAESLPHAVLVSNGADEAPQNAISLMKKLSADRDVVVLVGGLADSPAGMPTAYRVAEDHLRLAPLARPTGGAVGCDELALYRLLDTATPEERADFCIRVLGDLRKLSRDKRSELLETCEALIAERWNTRAASRALGVHYQTMRYRLRRVQEVTGRDLSIALDRLLLEVAVRVYRGWLAPLSDACEADRNAQSSDARRTAPTSRRRSR
jgi:hypothetical protein